MENSREKFKAAFPDEHSLIVALHSKNLMHAWEGAAIAIDNGAHGIALVTHIVSPEYGAYIASVLKEKYPYHKIILNILQREPQKIFETIKDTKIDAIWTDNARIPGIDRVDEHDNSAEKLLQRQQEQDTNILYFGGLDFKHQKKLSPEEYPFAIQQAKKYLDVITTSGSATWVSADAQKVKHIKQLAGSHPVGLASGVTAENIHEYIANTDISIVASGISHDYRNLDTKKVAELAQKIKIYNRKMERKHFEAATLQKYNMQTATELYKFFQTGEVINIGMHPEFSEEQQKLSNLYPSPFTLDNIRYASVEAFWMSIKYPEWDPRRVEIRELSGLAAKKSGKDAKDIKTLHYQGKEIIVGSSDHHALMKRAIRAKLEQNPDILNTLLDTGDKKLTHIVFTRHENEKFILHDSKTIPGEIFAKIYTELREEFRNK